MSETKTYKVGEIFKPIPDDPENVIMQIPPELCEQMGWTEGDTIHISVDEGVITLSKV
jgi:anaerobic selenocysteine-containing dehydrogenase